MEHSTEMQEEQQAPLIFTEGPAPIIKTKNQIFTAWSIAFLGGCRNFGGAVFIQA